MIIIQYLDLFDKLKSILLRYKFSNKDAEICAQIFANNTLVGVASHGINRFSSFIELINKGYIKVDSKPTLIKRFGALEQWDANLGPGPINAWIATDRAMELASETGIGCVAYKNSNHWMRAGTYGWKAAEKGFVFICWTNTIPNLPPWGAKQSTTGNNPIVFAFPRKDGPLVLDMALSQFSYGKLSAYKADGKPLPLDGGYDTEGELTKVPEEIIKSQRPLPVGFWKGSGLSLLLDLIATTLAGGRSTFDMSKYDVDYGMSQMFIAINPANFSSAEAINEITEQIIGYYKSAERIEGQEIFYPGERALITKEKFLKNGIPISKKIWEKISEF